MADVAGEQLTWVQPARLHQAFELHASDDVVATLRFDKRSLATGETSNKRWTFNRQGFWRPSVTISVPDSDVTALFKPAWKGGGSLELPQGGALRFGAANFWRSQWEWSDGDANPLVHFKSNSRLMRTEGRVDIEAGARAVPELQLLVVLGWYLVILSSRDAAEAGSVAAAGAAGAAGS